MKPTHLFIMFLILDCLLAGCRANLESKARQSRQHTDEIGVVLHRVDSLCSTISEKQTIRIEYYPPDYNTTCKEVLGNPRERPLSPTPAAPSENMPAATVGLGSTASSGGGMGAVKSIEITTERGTSTGSVTAVDSVVDHKIMNNEVRQTEKASEARHDNGTVLIVSVVAAAVLLLALIIIIKKLFHK